MKNNKKLIKPVRSPPTVKDNIHQKVLTAEQKRMLETTAINQDEIELLKRFMGTNQSQGAKECFQSNLTRVQRHIDSLQE